MRARTPSLLILLLALSVLAAACSGSGAAEPGGGGATAAPSPTEEPTVDLGDGGQVPADATVYEYSNGEVAARLTLQGARGRLRIVNRSGREIGEPGLYALDSTTGRRVGGTVEDAAPIPDGATVTLRVSFPDGFGQDRIGLVALLVGSADYGAFIPS